MTRETTRSTRWALVPSLMIMFGAVMSVGPVGCASQAELPPQMTENLTGLRDQLLQGKAQVQTTCNAARDLTQRPQAQLQPQIDRLMKSIADLENLATKGRQQFASAEEHTQAYFAHWDKEMEGLSKSLAEQGQQRKAQSMASFNELKLRVDALRAEFRPFMTSLQEVSRYLKTDTTSAGVKAASPQINSAIGKENTIMAKADAVISQIDAMKGGK